MQIQSDYDLKMRIETQARVRADTRQSAKICQGLYAVCVMTDLLWVRWNYNLE